MSKHAAIRVMLERAYQTRPRVAPRGRDRVPRPPHGPELAYVQGMRRLMREIGSSSGPLFARLADLVGTRDDAADGSAPEVRSVLRQLRDVVRDITRARIAAGLVSDVADQTNATNLREMSRVLGIDRLALLPNAPMDLWTRENVELITSVGDEFLVQVEELVTTAANTGLRHEELSRQLQERLGVAESRAALIARDQVLKANADLAHARMRRVGVTEYIWRATPDHRTRPDHAALDGQRFRFDAPPVVDQRTGRRENPGRDFQCRCQAEPVFDGE